MGVHTGLASPRNGDYVALRGHQAARVTAAAHGGQILASEAAVTDTCAHAGLALRHVGRYRLRDFDEPVQLFQLAGPGLDADFPRFERCRSTVTTSPGPRRASSVARPTSPRY